ncbi:protein-tyrosine phosphatase [Lachnospiraceae bacterium]|nr:protein-tyrosine phosphatase [Lachnospiraceae bacterium]
MSGLSNKHNNEFIGEQLSKRLDFQSLHNIRDLGGMKTTSGKAIKEGCFIRCGHLSEISASDEKKLQELVDIIVDFRSDKEREEKPDKVIEGISYVHIPIVDSLTAGVTREKRSDKDIIARLAMDPVTAKKYLCEMYIAFAGDYSVSQYSKFIKLILDACREKAESSDDSVSSSKGAVLWHCTAGKDRAGIASVIIEEILGVSRKDIIEDYLSTNIYLEADIHFLTNFVKEQAGIESSMADEALRLLFGADKDYIESYYKAIEEKYGDFGNFIREGLGLSENDMAALCQLHLV